MREGEKMGDTLRKACRGSWGNASVNPELSEATRSWKGKRPISPKLTKGAGPC